jgi:mono/diheme cytochrome c family protein
MSTMTKTILKRAAQGAAILAAAVAAFAVYVQIDGIPRYAPPPVDTRVAVVTPEQVAHGKKLVNLLCVGCHENAETHRLTGKRITDLPPQFGIVYSKNITRHPTKGIGGLTDGQLRTILRTGLRPDGEYVPPFMIKMPHTSDQELDAIIAFLRSDDPLVAASDVDPPGVTQPSFLAKALAHVAFGPLPAPKGPVVAPPKSDAVAYGRYLVASLDCFGCHSADFTKNNALEPEKSAGFMGGGNALTTEGGKPIFSANLTSDPETGIGNWTEAEFVRAVKKGFRPDGRVLSYPMEPRPELDDDEAAAIYAYLRTVPKIRNAVRRPAAPVADANPGKAVYERYGCNTCHGDTGIGAVADLRHANQDYPTDADLRRWIDDAPSVKPNTRMPGWKGVIKEDDYGPLLAYVRVLSAAKDEHAER